MGWPAWGGTTKAFAAQRWPLISAGVLVGYQLDRRLAALTGIGEGRSNGCVFADSPAALPIPRMANVSLQPDPGGLSTAELIARVERGLYLVGDKSFSIDQQRRNFQFTTAQRAYLIVDGRLGGQVKDFAYQATTTEFWRALEAVGGPPNVPAERFVQLRQGPAQSARTCRPRRSGGIVPWYQHPQHRHGGRLMTPQELAERALGLSTANGCVVLIEHVDRANLRWANNTLTTNGVTHGQRVTVISTIAGHTGTAAGVLTRAGVDENTLADLVTASETAARAAGPAADAQPLVAGDTDQSWDEPAGQTSINIFTDITPALGEAFGMAGATGRLLFGYAEHETRTTYLGTSAGLRRRHTQPTGRLLVNAKSRDLSRSAYLGLPTEDFTDVDVLSVHDTLATQLGWATRQIELPAGRYETLLPPAAVADLVGFGHWAGGSARDAVDGRSVYSGPVGGTRIGEQLCGDGVRVTLSSDPHAIGLACAPFVMAHASNGLESVFDDGLALLPTDWIRDGELINLITHPAHCGADRPAGQRPTSTT